MTANQRFTSREVLMRWTGYVLVLLVVSALLPSSARAQGTETVVYFHTDAIGSVRMITDANGQEVERFDHAPFGEPWPAPSPTEGPRFAWSEHDPATGLNYLSARDLLSATGRFTAVDPGHVGGNLSDSQSWNGYAYARNNPLRFVDPMGTDYYVFSVNGGGSFWFDEGFGDYPAFKRFLGSGFSILGDPYGTGIILNSSGSQVAEYAYVERMARLFGDAGRSAAPAEYFASAAVAFIGGAIGPAAGMAPISLGVTRTAAPIVNAAAQRAIAGVLKQIAQGTTKGKVFRNFEGKLPLKAAGYYREHTVSLAGQSGRGTARIVTGANGEVYYTANHYGTFVRVR